MIKAMAWLCMMEVDFNIIKVIHNKSTAVIILSEENLETFQIISDTRQGYPPSPLLFNIALTILAKTLSQEMK